MSNYKITNNISCDAQFSAYLQKAISEWQIGVVLCTYEKASFAELERLICRWACEVDKKMGKVTRSMGSQHPQRIEKAIKLEYTREKRFWHANAILNKPGKYSTEKFTAMLHLIWLDVLSKDQRKQIGQCNDLFWGETIYGEFRGYAFKKQAEADKFVWQISSGQEPIHFKSLTIHNSTIK